MSCKCGVSTGCAFVSCRMLFAACCVAILAIPPTVDAATVTMMANDSGATSSFTGAGNWSDGLAPAAGNAYESTGFLIQYSAQVPSSGYTFGGDSLTLKGGARFACGAETIGGSRWITIPSLTLDNGQVSHSRGGGNPVTMTGAMTIASGGATLYSTADSFTWAGTVTGSGALAVTQGTVTFSGTQTYTGNVTISSGATFAAAPSGNLSNAGTMQFNNTDTRSFNAANYSGAGSIVKTGSGTINVSGSWAIASNLHVGYGQVRNAGSIVMASGGAITVGSGASHNVYVGVGIGSDGNNGPSATLDASQTASFTANVANFKVGGTVGGTGTVALGALNMITASTMFGISAGDWGFPNGYGAVTTAASSTTTIVTPTMHVGYNLPNGTTGGWGKFTLGSGGSFTLGAASGGRTAVNVGVIGGWNGASEATASDFNLAGGGTGVADLKLNSLLVGQLGGGGGTAKGILTMSSAAGNRLDVSGTGNVVLVGDNGGSGSVEGTLTVGNLGTSSAVATTNGATAILLASKRSSGSVTGALTLGSGTLTITTTGTAIAGGGGTSTLNLDGTVLVAGTSSTSWIAGLTSAKVRSGGVTFNTNGFDIGVPQALLTEGTSAGGGLTKSGGGTLTLSGSNTFTGPTTITGGRLAVTSSSQLLSSSVTIGSGAELYFRSAASLGTAPVFSGTGSTLDASGTMTGSLDVTANNTLAIGSTPLTVTGLTLGDNTTVRVESGGSSRVQINGNYSDSLGPHSLVTGFTASGTPYTFFSWTGSSGSLVDGTQSNWAVQEGDTGTKKWSLGNSGSWESTTAWDGFAGTVTADTTAKTLSYALSYVSSGTRAPGSGHDAVIDPTAAAVTVAGPSSAAIVKTLTVGGTNATNPTLALGAGSLTATQSVTVTGNGVLDATTGAVIAPTLTVNGAGAAATLANAASAITTANVSAGSLILGTGTVTTANVSGGQFTANGGTVSVANLTGTGHLAGGLAVPQVNVTAGTPSFSGRATTMTVTGGGVTTSSGTITTFQHNAGSGTSTIGASTAVTTVSVAAGTVNYNSTVTSGTLIMPASSTGTVVVGSGAAAAVVNLESGAGTFTAQNPLSVTNRILFADRFSAQASGAAFTVQTAVGANLVSNAAARTFTVNGGTMTLATVGAPSTVGINYFQVTDDTTSGLTSAKTYTHAIDWGSSGAATVNGVAFSTDVNQSAGGRSNAGTRTYGSAGAHAGNTPPAVSGNVVSVFTDMLYGGPDPGYVELTGLTANTWYDVRLYERAWDYGGSIRTYYNLFDVGADGNVEYTTPKIDQNRANLTPPGMSGNVSWITSYIYQADATGKMRVTIDLAADQNGTYHLYGLSNEVVPAGSGINNFPDTSLAVASSSEINLGSASAAHTLGQLSVQGAGSVVTLSGAQSVSFNGITSPGSGSIAAGVPISLRSGTVNVSAAQTLTMNGTIVNGTQATSLIKAGDGTLVLSASNSFTGGVQLNAGVVSLGHAAALGSSGTITFGGGSLQYGAGVAPDLSGRFSTAPGQAYSFDTNGQAMSLANSLTSVGGSLTKLGAGRLTLSGSNTFSGPTTISGGTLALASGASLASSYIKAGATAGGGGTFDVTDLSGGLLLASGQKLGGHGTVLGNVVVGAGSFIAPGGSIGTLTQTGTQTWASAGTYTFEVTNAGGAAGTGWDLLNVDALQITASAGVGNQFVIDLQSLTSGTDTTAGAMSGGNWNANTGYQWKFVVANAAISSFDSTWFKVDTTNFLNTFNANGFSVARGDQVSGGQTNELYVVYAAVPEPGTLALAGIGLAALGLGMRRRRRRAG